jgi:hypothetical protein
MKWMKKFPNVKKGLSCSLKDNHVRKGARFKLPQGTTMFLGEIFFFFSKDMIVP